MAQGKRRVSVSTPRGSTGSKKAPVGSSLLDGNTGNLRSAKRLSGRGEFSPGSKLLSNTTDRVLQPKIVKVVDRGNGQGSAKVGAGGRYANMNTNIVKAKIMREPKQGVQGTGGAVGSSRVVRPKTTAVRLGTGGTAHIRNV